MKTRMAALFASERPDLPALLDDLPVGVAVLDGEGRVRFLNKTLESLTGFAREDVRGLPCRHVLRSRACVQGCPWARSEGEGGSLETDLINRHRRRIAVRLTPVLLRDAEGRELARLEIIEDLTPIKEMEDRLSQAAGPGQMVGRSQAMEKLLRLVPVIAQSDSPVLITGETGTGKDLLAEAVHRASPRSREPFVRFSCGPMPEELLEADLFGRRGSGGEGRPGRFQQAHNGTLYLSEIADLPVQQQARLVRCLDERAILPVGADKPVRVNVRLIASTNADPEALIRSGRLREDLFHRLAAVRLHLPPLRQRGEDVSFLLQHFLGVYAARFKKSIVGFSPKALRLLSAYSFPGNVRELKNIVEFAAMVCSGETILPAHLPAHLPGAHDAAEPAPKTARKTGRKAKG
ncbi:sigma-54 interaction domain-containing protein [Desulfovibrio aminophilus]|uniref:sigma-54 interaction domain-containing protein n=1 Tax=Desulfovibrio aminophilus TaxID=81425 RepID=UPI0012EBF00A|nr:sigma 54-interacting transcriptional regulator [Desulfovibrio aminophilus]